MLMDELDTRLNGDGGEALRGVLNSGFQRTGKHTICDGDKNEDRDFSTFCPKVLCGIGEIWPTVASRSIPIRLNRATKEQLAAITKIRGDRIGAILLPIRRQLRRFADDSLGMLRIHDPVIPEQLSARQTDVWRPLLAIADVAGGHWPATARAAAVALQGAAAEEGDSALLVLQDVRDIFMRRGADVIPSADIVQILGAMEDRPWSEYRRDGRPISATALAKLLKRFDVRPRTHRIDAHTTAKGYARVELQKVFDMYLNPIPADLSVTTVTIPAVTDVTDETSTGTVVSETTVSVI